MARQSNKKRTGLHELLDLGSKRCFRRNMLLLPLAEGGLLRVSHPETLRPLYPKLAQTQEKQDGRRTSSAQSSLRR